MKRSFSFSEKPVLFILRKLPSILPGIEKVVVIYFDQDKGINSYSIHRESNEYLPDEFIIQDTNVQIVKLRNDHSPYSWIRQNDVPFEIVSNQKIQLTIFNELDNSILLIRIKNDFDSLSDLFFIYLNSNLGNFGLLNNLKPLTTENKTIIGQLVRNTILSYLLSLKEDKEVFGNLQENTVSVIQQMNEFRQAQIRMEEKFKTGIVHLCKIYLSELSREHAKVYRFTDLAVKKLQEFEGDMSLLKPVIEKAARFAETMYLESDDQIVEISDYHLIFKFVPEIQKTESTEISEIIAEIPVKYNKTFLLLNKLENAAENLKSKNKLLTSINVGNEFSTPISPPAITDALKKHRQKIVYLFKEFPGRWEIIRSEFRPIQNILNVRDDRHKNTA